MRLKFGMPQTEETVNTCIVIVEIEVNNQTTVIGALADSVQEVLNLDPEQIEPAPKIGMRLNADIIKGIGKRDEEFVIILDIDKIFSIHEFTLVKDVGRGNAEQQEE